jgi:hypothetical protein
MAKTKKKENQYLFTVDGLAEFAGVTPRWIYQLIQDRRLWKNADGFIDCAAYPNIGTVTTLLPPGKLARYDAFIRETYHLPPPGSDFDD